MYGNMRNRGISVNNFGVLIGYLVWKPPSLSELTTMTFNMGLTHLG